MQSDIIKPMPSNKQLERKILSWFFVSSELTKEVDIILNLLYDIDFYYTEHKFLFKAIKKVFTDNKSIDMTLVAPVFEKQLKDAYVENIDAIMFVADIEIEASSAVIGDINVLVKTLKQYTIKRRIIEEINKTYDKLFEDNYDIDEYISNSIAFYKKISIYLNDMLDRALTLSDVSVARMPKGVPSGFITHDWNDSGLKPGCVTLLLGARGQGKTTLARQMMVSVSIQKKRVYFFSGEETKELEKNNIARIFSKEDELIIEENEAGRKIYYPSDRAIEKIDRTIGKYITIRDTSDYPTGDIWNAMYKELLSEAQRGTYLFIIDNMMIINEAQGRMKFDQQKVIMKQLKDFAREYGVHVLVLAHPKKGIGDQTTSGVAEQENLVDTIIRYKRIDRDDKACVKLLAKCNLSDNIKKDVSACLLVEKIRNNGRYEIAWFTWDTMRGCVWEISTLPKAFEYVKRGFWVLPVHKYNDNPQQ